MSSAIKVFALMHALSRDGVPVLLIEQNLRSAIELTTRFDAIERGQSPSAPTASMQRTGAS